MPRNHRHYFWTILEAHEHLAKVARSNRRKLANNTHLLIHEDGSFGVELHATEVVRVWPDRMRLQSGGYRTVTTKERINRYLPNAWGLFQEDFEWKLSHRAAARDFRPFQEGMMLHKDGSVTV